MAPVQLSSCPFNERSLRPCNTPLLCSSAGFFLLPPTSFFSSSFPWPQQPGQGCLYNTSLSARSCGPHACLLPPRPAVAAAPPPPCPCRAAGGGAHSTTCTYLAVCGGALPTQPPIPPFCPRVCAWYSLTPLNVAAWRGAAPAPPAAAPIPRVLLPPESCCLPPNPPQALCTHPPTHPADGSALPRLPCHTPSLHPIPSLLRILSCFSPTITHGGRGRRCSDGPQCWRVCSYLRFSPAFPFFCTPPLSHMEMSLSAAVAISNPQPSAPLTLPVPRCLWLA